MSSSRSLDRILEMIVAEKGMATSTPTPELDSVPRNMCRNLSDNFEAFRLTETEKYLSILMFPISVVVLLGNGWIFQTIARMKTRKKYYHIIASLTISDSFLMIACILLAYECLTTERSFIYMDFLPDYRWVVASYFEVMSLLHVILLASERCVAVKYPFKHRQLQKKHFIGAITTLWIASIFITLMLYTASYFGYSKCRYGTVYLNNGIVALTVIIAIAFHVTIFKAATKSKSGIAGSINRKTINRHRSTSRLSRSDVKAARTTLIVLLGFVVCFTPYVIASNISYFYRDLDKINSPALTIGYFLAIFNVFINSIVYGLLNVELRRAALAPLRTMCSKDNVEAAHNQTRRASDAIFRLRVNQLEQCDVGVVNERCVI